MHIIYTGNIMLSNHDVMLFDGVGAFLQRKRELKDKSLSGGALVDYNVFGLT